MMSNENVQNGLVNEIIVSFESYMKILIDSPQFEKASNHKKVLMIHNYINANKEWLDE